MNSVSNSTDNEDAAPNTSLCAIDSRASSNMRMTKALFTDYTKFKYPEYVTVADETKFQGVARDTQSVGESEQAIN